MEENSSSPRARAWAVAQELSESPASRGRTREGGARREGSLQWG